MRDEKLTRKDIIDYRLKQAGWNVGYRSRVIEEAGIIVDANMIQLA